MDTTSHSLKQGQVRWGFWFIIFCIGLTSIALSWRYVEQDGRINARKTAEETVAVRLEALEGLLARFRSLPPVLSRMRDIEFLFEEPVDGERIHAKLSQLAYLSGASDVALHWADGGYISSARGLFKQNLSQRPDAAELIAAPGEARLGRATMLMSDAQRLYAFSSMVFNQGKPKGVIIFYVNMASVEEAWGLSALPIYIFDQTGEIILSNVKDWRGKQERDVSRYGYREYLIEHDLHRPEVVTRELLHLGWTIKVLGVSKRLAQAKRYALMMCVFATASLALGWTLFHRRREQMALNELREKANALRLEALVESRTVDLHQEIEERKAAEKKLIQAQQEVVRAAKLAAIGQMSATLSHEYNQPLMAIGTYADNANKFLERDKPEQAAKNLSLIQQQIDRMAALSKTLLGFARKSGDHARPVYLNPILDESFLLVTPRARKSSVTLSLADRSRDIHVVGGKIRLSQVFINLINNAIDAVAVQEDGLVVVSVHECGDFCEIRINDNGPGIAPDQVDQIFEPFYTSKPAGAGLGIGLSVVSDIVNDFGGSVRVGPSELGGAQFTVSLQVVSETEGIIT